MGGNLPAFPRIGKTLPFREEPPRAGSISAIPADQIGNAMKDLLAERESWGTEPSMSEPA